MVFTAQLRASLALLSATAVTVVHASSHVIFGGLKPLANERMDPIVDPNVVSGHVHSVFGANNFNQNSDYDSLRQANCTNIPYQTVDKSSYWMPPAYYQDQNTHELTLLPITTNIYYFFDRNGPNETVQAFPEGLRMVAGDPTRGTYNASSFADQAVSFVCLDYSGAVSNDPDYAERQDINFPDPNKCEDGIRYQIFFPMCWDGVNLDSADHKSHMAYPVDAYNTGTCPSSHPVHLVGIFFEMIVPMTNNYWGPGALVLSTGDPTGLAFHADFMNGWDVSMLQEAVEDCHNMNGDITLCQTLAPYIDETAAGACTLDADIVNENVQGPLTQLPGCNPIQVPTGSMPTCANPPPTPGFVNPVAPLTAGWENVGCIAEATNARALTGTSTTSPNMTLNYCATYCQSQGFTLAGVEFGDECYCGNSFSNGATGAVVDWDQCSTPCASDPTYSKCGGPQRLQLLKYAPGAAGAAPATPSSASVSVAAPSVSPSSVAAPPPSSVAPSSVAAPSGSSASAPSSIVSLPENSSASAPISTPSATPVTPQAPITTGSQVFVQQTSAAAAPSGTPGPTTGAWTAAGCAQDGPARALTGYQFSANNMTNDVCTTACAQRGFTMAGTEYSTECYCGNAFSNGLGQPITSGPACYMGCGGDVNTKCGGSWSLSVFTASGASAPAAPASPAAPSPASASAASASAASTPASGSSSSAPVSAGTWVAAGCVSDGPARALTGAHFTDANMTTAKCTSLCAAQSFTMAGTEYSTECYCGNAFSNGLGQPVTSGPACYMGCGGDVNTKCGGSWTMNLYTAQGSSSSSGGANAKRSKHFGRNVHYRSHQF